jgi:hypothetical protein
MFDDKMVNIISGLVAVLSRFRTDDLTADLSELVFLELYLVGFWVYAIGEMLREKARAGTED